MKAVVKASGKVIEVEPNYHNGEIVSWTQQREDSVPIIYMPEEIYVNTSEIENERLCKELKQELDAPEIRYTKDVVYCDWDAIRISAAQSALQACIIAGQKDPVRASIAYADELIKELQSTRKSTVYHYEGIKTSVAAGSFSDPVNYK